MFTKIKTTTYVQKDKNNNEQHRFENNSWRKITICHYWIQIFGTSNNPQNLSIY